jgi:hypothetical protein
MRSTQGFSARTRQNAVHESESDYRSVVDATFMGTGNEQTNPLLQRYKEQDD